MLLHSFFVQHLWLLWYEQYFVHTKFEGICYALHCLLQGDVLKTRSTETLPFYLILANVVVAGQWFLYGIAINNSFVQVKYINLFLKW